MTANALDALRILTAAANVKTPDPLRMFIAIEYARGVIAAADDTPQDSAEPDAWACARSYGLSEGCSVGYYGTALQSAWNRHIVERKLTTENEVARLIAWGAAQAE